MENRILKAIIYDERYEIISKIEPDWFLSKTHKDLFKETIACLIENKRIDIDALKTRIHASQYPEAIKNQMLFIINDIKELFLPYSLIESFEEYYIENKIKKLTEHLNSKDSTHESKHKKILDTYQNITKNKIAEDFETAETLINQYVKNVISGVDNVFKEKSIKINTSSIAKIFDDYVCPFPIIIASRPGMHKTSMLINLVNDFLYSGKTGLYFSFEDTKQTLTGKLLSHKNNWTLKKVLYAEYTDTEKEKLKVNYSKYNRLWINDKRYNLIRFRAEVDKQFSIRKYDFICIDYLQLFLMDKGLKRHECLDLICQEFISICHDYMIPVICLCSVNDRDESNDYVELHLGNLSGSGAIEQHARQVIIINGKRSESIRQVKIVKNTGGGLKNYQVTFNNAGIIEDVENGI